jgi:hypothetical protein
VVDFRLKASFIFLVTALPTPGSQGKEVPLSPQPNPAKGKAFA